MKWISPGACFCVALLVQPCVAMANGIELAKGMHLLDARKVLKMHGWRPIDLHEHDGYEFIGVERLLRDQGISEVESCAIDRGLCIFNYRKGTKCIRLLTTGEEVDRMQVDSWVRACPDGR